MDNRKEKTRAAIKEAFLKLYSRRSLEKITIKELCAMAGINKSTFYCHYADVYDLCDQLQEETVRHILSSMPDHFKHFHSEPAAFTRALVQAFEEHSDMISGVFSGREQGQLVEKLELGIKELLFQTYPYYRDDPQMHLLLDYSIYGGYYAWQRNQCNEPGTHRDMIEKIADAIQPLFK